MKMPDTGNLSTPSVYEVTPLWARWQMWHPQWGGYCFPCVVEFPKTEEGSDPGFQCFEVYEWHDGQFATDHVVTQRHYCDPLQVLNFALSVMECMGKEGQKPSEREQEILSEAARRIIALRGLA